tara:strand:+ start:66 stop:638 length:573 start_codon:yes stop_codon:yes gene_type:complete
MLEKYFKNASEAFAVPFIKILKYFNLKPNTVSIFGLVVIISGSYCFYLENRVLGIILIFLGSAIDGLDGPYARQMNLVSEKGAILDSLIDRIGELIIWSVVGISFTNNDIEIFTIFAIVVSSNLIPYMRAKSEYYGLLNKKGLAARPERVIFAVLFMFFDFNFSYVYIFAVVTWITAIQRFIYLYQYLSK